MTTDPTAKVCEDPPVCGLFVDVTMWERWLADPTSPSRLVEGLLIFAGLLIAGWLIRSGMR